MHNILKCNICLKPDASKLSEYQYSYKHCIHYNCASRCKFIGQDVKVYVVYPLAGPSCTYCKKYLTHVMTCNTPCMDILKTTHFWEVGNTCNIQNNNVVIAIIHACMHLLRQINSSIGFIYNYLPKQIQLIFYLFRAKQLNISLTVSSIRSLMSVLSTKSK